MKDKIKATVGTPEEEVLEKARTTKKIAPYLEGKEILNAIYVPGRIVNLVIR